MKALLIFGSATFAIFLAAAVLSIYSFDQYDSAWGRGGSLRAEVWLCLVGALIAAGAFGLASAFARRAHSDALALMLGVSAAGAFLLAGRVVYNYQLSAGVYIALLLLVGFSAVAALGGRRTDV